MKYTTALLALASVVLAEVPQEHSHNAIIAIVNVNLKSTNTLNIEDAIFGLLGNKAAAGGAGKVTNLDCLQQEIADQAFTNAKAAKDVNGQANAIMYRALERNTGSVGLASVLCNETAVNVEIVAISQHQDPASTGAADHNKQVALNVAIQLASIGADPTLAIQTGTFAPGNLGDTTAKGNSCDTSDDTAGCIVSQKLLVPDVTADEIAAAVKAGSAAAAAAAAGNATVEAGSGGVNCTALLHRRRLSMKARRQAAAAGCDIPVPTCASSASSSSSSAAAAVAPPTTSASASTTTSAAAAAAATPSSLASAIATGTNVQTFTGSLGGPPPPVVSDAAANPTRPFTVKGNTFVNASAALQRSCAIQHNACADAANAKSITASVSDCGAQEDACNAA